MKETHVRDVDGKLVSAGVGRDFSFFIFIFTLYRQVSYIRAIHVSQRYPCIEWPTRFGHRFLEFPRDRPQLVLVKGRHR